MPFERQFDESEVLDNAMNAFWARGYEATSISDLVAATGLQRGSLYAAYSDKHGLFCAALRHYDLLHRDAFLRNASRGRNGFQAIMQTFRGAAKVDQTGLPSGCLLVNTALEVSPHDKEIKEIVGQSLHMVEEFFAHKVRDGKIDGSISKDVSVRETAASLLGLFMGLRVATRAGISQRITNSICEQVDRMLG